MPVGISSHQERQKGEGENPASMIHEYHTRQYDSMYESTCGLLEFMEECVGEIGEKRIIDGACGAGANVYHMLKRWPACYVTGVDINAELLDFARSKVPIQSERRCRYEQVNLFDLPNHYSSNAFDLATLIQTLGCGWFGPDEYPEVLRALVQVTSRWIFLISLFTEKRMDVTAQIRDYVRFREDARETITYSIFCMSRFRRVCKQLGVKEVIFRDFWINIDLVGPPEGGIGTYTVKLEDGRRLQFSGAVFMPWKFVGLRLR